jgi:hypothetical protein
VVWVEKNYPKPPDVELLELYVATGGELQAGWEERNAERVATYRDFPGAA